MVKSLKDLPDNHGRNSIYKEMKKDFIMTYPRVLRQEEKVLQSVLIYKLVMLAG
jgi:hypothetical protein